MNEMHSPIGHRRCRGRVGTPLPINRGSRHRDGRCRGQEDDVAGALAGTSLIDERIVTVEAVAVGAAAMAAPGGCIVTRMTGVATAMTARMTSMVGGGDGLGAVPAIEVRHRGHRARRQADGHPERGRQRPPPALPMAKPCLPVAFVSH